MKFQISIAALVAISGYAFAQDTGGVAQTPQTGTVIKGKAPVAKDLLKVKFPKPKSFRLSDGATVYLLEDHRAPVVRFSIEMTAGTMYEPKPGVANLTATMLADGTTSRTGDQIAEQLEDMGANLNANAGVERTTLSGASLSESTDKLVELMADVLLHPSFAPDRLDRAKFGQRSGLAQRGTNPTATVAELSNQVFYGGTKIARPVPTRQDIAAITADDLKGFYADYYRPEGAIIGVTGDITADAAKSLLERNLAEWKGGKGEVAAAEEAPKPKTVSHIFLIDRPNSAQTVVQFGALAVPQTDPDFVALTVANRILGGGSSGRLFQNIRERKGYTYGAYSTLAAARWPGVWGANASVRTEVTEPAIAEFYAEFKRLQDEPVSQEELERAKRSIIGGFALALQSPDAILARTLEQVQNHLPANFWDTYPARIESVTPADVQRVARKYLGGSNLQLLVVGERKKIEPGLQKFGSVEIVEPAKISSVSAN